MSAEPAPAAQTARTDRVTISLPDGSVRSFDAPVTGADVAAAIGPGLARAVLAARIDGELRPLWACDTHVALPSTGAV